MPDASGAPAALPQLRPLREGRRRVSPLLRRILLVNMVAPALLAASLLYLDQYQTGLLAAEVESLRTQARIYAAGIAEAAVRLQDDRAVLVPDTARPLLRRLVEPSANTQAKLFDTSGLLVADSRVREGQGGAIITEPLTPPETRGLLAGGVGRFYDRLLTILPRSLFGARRNGDIYVDVAPDAPSFDWQPELGPDRREELRLALEGGVRPYIRRTKEGRLLVSVAEPARRGSQSIGIVLLTREAREVDQRLLEIRTSVLGLFVLALLLTVAASLYLSRTIASPILALAGAAAAMRQGKGRAGSVPTALLARTDEIGILARDLQSSATALWARIDQNERFAADVAHELRNPLTSVRSALETLLRVEKPDQQKRLLSIIAEDAVRMDRLIGDIADSSRVDAELSRTVSEPVDVAPILSALVELHNTTRDEDEDPVMVLDAAPVPLVVRGVEGRLVQVFRNLLGNAVSFSPKLGTVWVRARQTGAMMEFTIEDEGPGIPEAKLEGIFDRFYTERPTGESFGQHSGLGLSISRQIVEGLGGRISAENRRDENGKVIGARFVVRLPVG
ncbi:HAMP domain-containing protein [Pseudoroseomonas wenyumeiae]|uniref:histidine kinase n=1 Tax=Teichococcus wenyumeiae TaxID=2478470 RepID=A0A3A9JUJ1_9PROT|nr:stimulus-sensing domain-containing protein [Pseudoroseomonas wenyumeiae]RKK04428.1 HAMP domain-containing protein [Pseudoroseomonas wenyumeiae]RMI25351.1 HAMP domain-containing protein [Pseudoroseomonas wenyumeiae]